ncbi:MAG TPA: hypothetical protein PLJ35_08075 [Anaerolineae bacterium]|nr:hypothetical protein [Anaerolineae bacterium]HOQ98765.1 hypothetical protein [Anaerolineae bacterium]
MRETIQLGEGDNVFVARQKLQQAQSGQVALVVPVGSGALCSELDLVLVQRAAQALALDLVLVTDDSNLAGLARSLGMKTASGSGRVVRGGGGRPAQRDLRHAAVAPLPERAPRLYGEVTPPGEQRGQPLALRRLQWRDVTQHAVLWLVGAAAVLVLLLGLALAVPSATVVLEPKGDVASAEAEVVASPSVQQVDYEKGRVPARQVRLEVIGEDEVQTTGKRSASDKHAAGDVVLVNKTTSEATVPKGTVVRTADGNPIKFYTLLDVTLPGAYGATARVPIQAAEPGPRSNVEALTIRVVEGEPSVQVEVLNDAPVQGGNEKRVSVVASQDGDRLRATMVQKLQQRAYEELVAGLSQGDWIPADSLDVAIVDEVFDKKVDEEAEQLRLTMKVLVTGLAVDGQGTRALLTRALESRSTSALVVNEATLKVQAPVGSAQVESGAVRFRAAASATLVPAINLRAVSGRIAGKDPESAAAWLAEQCELSQPPQIDISPSWWPRLPWMPSRITVQLSGG